MSALQGNWETMILDLIDTNDTAFAIVMLFFMIAACWAWFYVGEL